ncbi:hypothetical protein C943_02364 [Mariniradius saccharolyticus AK6]|uniref:Uncharacterized protein n=1 Tax=Mariniradius saccharolyticus AK6 TaxID=1239962 RepID=M7XRQ2_9BACT|nr:hypothetical protein C943_02364 [Mariniradius saccharolyticus AK6]
MQLQAHFRKTLIKKPLEDQQGAFSFNKSAAFFPFQNKSPYFKS